MILQRAKAWNHERLRARRAAQAERDGETADYARWVLDHDTIDDTLRLKLHARARALRARPLISVLMPVFDPDPHWLRAAIDSVRAQVYGDWELCIADDRSTDPRIQGILSEYAQRDPRIRVTFRDANGHICAASNTALGMARGQFVALLDHDDLLPEHALLCVAETIARFPDTAIIYSDEDKLDAQGRRCDPYFKSDFNLGLLRAQNCLSHLGVYRRALVEKVGGFREGYEGAQDHDLALRCVEAVAPKQIVHIPHVLYHWRAHARSTAVSGDAKPYAHLAGRRALEAHFARTGIACKVTSEPAGWYRVTPDLPEPPPSVAILVVDTGNAWWRSLDAVRRATDYPAIERIQRISVRPGLSLADACNCAIAASEAELIAIVDRRCRFETKDWLRQLVARACLPGAAAVGAKVLSPAGRIVGCAMLLGARGTFAPMGEGTRGHRGGYFGRARLPQYVSALGHGALVLRKARLKQVDWLDPALRDMHAALVDLTCKFDAYGWRNQWAADVACTLTLPAATTGAIARSDAARVTERWDLRHRRDPCYNDNLGLASARFRYATHPRVWLAHPWFDAPAHAPHPASEPTPDFTATVVAV